MTACRKAAQATVTTPVVVVKLEAATRVLAVGELLVAVLEIPERTDSATIATMKVATMVRALAETLVAARPVVIVAAARPAAEAALTLAAARQQAAAMATVT